jgi:hypothetical protein
MTGRIDAVILLIALGLAAPTWAHDPKDLDTEQKEKPDDNAEERLNVYDQVEIRERADDLTGLTQAPSDGTTGYLDLQRRPIARAGELVETVPGVVATQHSGGGKANQYFLRGFNLDHGTDFSVTVAGVPVNMPSHGHGQGYADLSFLIPELVDRAAYRKGTYNAAAGDFSAAGSVDMRLVRRLDRGLVKITGGSYDFGRLLVANSVEVANGDLTSAVELFNHDGPWTRPGDFQRLNALVSYHRGDLSRGFSITAMGYDGDWLSTDQIPLREVRAGRLGRFDLVDPGPRGSTERYSISAEAHRGGDRSLSRLSGYLMSYDFNLISNFTYQLENPVRGDQFQQLDERIVVGLKGQHQWLGALGGRSAENRIGLDIRWDDIENGLVRTADLDPFDTVRRDSIEQLGAGVWADTTIRWHEFVRTNLGLRADSYRASVRSDLAANSGTADDVLLSPKVAILLGPFDTTEYFVNFGWGFHSNDARGATIRVDPAAGDPAERVEPLVRAWGGEIGFRASAGRWTTAVAAFDLELDSELVFVGDGGATEASRPSRRIGIEWTNHVHVNRHLALDADLTLTDAEFTDDDPAGTEIPGAIERTVAAGLTFRELGAFSGSLRWRYFGGIPLVEDGSVVWDSSSLVNAFIGYEMTEYLQPRLEIFNLLDREDSDIEYYYPSRLPGEPETGVEDVHFHPMEKRSARLTAAWAF